MERVKMYIDGKWIASASGKYRNIINPANGEIVYEAEEGTAKDAAAAAGSCKTGLCFRIRMEEPYGGAACSFVK